MDAAVADLASGVKSRLGRRRACRHLAENEVRRLLAAAPRRR